MSNRFLLGMSQSREIDVTHQCVIIHVILADVLDYSL